MELEVAPYPTHWEADVLLRDGTTMRIRPILPTDADALQAFHVAQSEESTYFRFFAPLRRLSDRDLRRLVKVDHDDRVALIVLDGPAIVAVARYDRVSPDRAEVAFNVADALQGQGLGSMLLEHLAAAARERGVSTFQADVLPGNAKMIHVFSDAGYDVVQRYEDGVISLEFTIDPTQRSLDVVASREHRTDAASMRQFMAPRAILVVAGSVESELAVRVAENLAGATAVTCVGDALGEVAHRGGHRWQADIASLEDGPAQLAIMSGTAQEVMDALEPLASVGVRGLVVLSDGFDGERPVAADTPVRAATTDTTLSQRGLLRAARALGVRLIGPRSLGILTQGEQGAINASLATVPPGHGSTALFSQTSAVGRAMLDLAGRYGLEVTTAISAGHRADVSGNDLLQFAADVPGIRAVALYLESLGNTRKFARVAQRVSESVPVVAVVGAAQREGGEGLGRRAVAEAMVAAGVIVTASPREMVETTQLLVSQPLPAGPRIAVLANSAAQAELAAAQVGHLDPEASVTVVGWSASASEFGLAAADLARDERWDAALVLYTPPLGEVDAEVFAAIRRISGQNDRTVLAVLPGVLGLTEDLVGASGEAVPAYGSVEDAVAALTHVVDYARWRRTDLGTLVEPEGMAKREAREVIAREVGTVATGRHVELGPDAAREFLHALGIDVLTTKTVRGARDALEAALEVGWPVVVKSSDPHLRRRPDLGGVRLDVSGPIDLVDAIRGVRARQGGSGPVLIQRMAPLGVACLVRGWVDDVVGPVITFGLTGDATDHLGDASYALPPLRTGEVHRLVTSVRAAARLRGDAHTPGVDIGALEDLVARVSDALDTLPQVHALELRPVLAGREAAVVLDARVVLASEVRPDGGRRALRG